MEIEIDNVEMQRRLWDEYEFSDFNFR